MELKSTSTVHGHLEKLESKGYIRKDPTKPRAIEILDKGVSSENIVGFNSEVINIPIVGQIAAGEPIFAEENIEEYREEIADLLPTGNIFYLKTRGDSMTPTIPENSYVMIREQADVEDGEIAAVLVNGDEETTLKRVKRQGDIVMLVADNPAYPPYIITKNNPARILGKAIKFSADL